MAAWLNTKTLAGLMFGVAIGVSMTFILGPAAGIPMGLGLGLLWAVVFNASRTARRDDRDAH
jgi:hypothetical protein